ncbi:uncharacterized protein METZ01_LOCUS266712, partial [marine metagenome]
MAQIAAKVFTPSFSWLCFKACILGIAPLIRSSIRS